MRKEPLFSIDDANGLAFLVINEGLGLISINHDVKSPILLGPAQAVQFADFLYDFVGKDPVETPDAEGPGRSPTGPGRDPRPLLEGLLRGEDHLEWIDPDNPTAAFRVVRMLGGASFEAFPSGPGPGTLSIKMPWPVVQAFSEFLDVGAKGHPNPWAATLPPPPPIPGLATPFNPPETVEELVAFATTMADAFSDVMEKRREKDGARIEAEFDAIPEDPWKDAPFYFEVDGYGLREYWDVEQFIYRWQFLFPGLRTLPVEGEGELDLLVELARFKDYPRWGSLKIGGLQVTASKEDPNEWPLYSFWRQEMASGSATPTMPGDYLNMILSLYTAHNEIR